MLFFKKKRREKTNAEVKKQKNPKKLTPELFQYYWYTITQVVKEKESY